MEEFISRLTWVEMIVFLVTLRGCYVGYKSGFFPELLRIVGYLITVIVAFRFHEEAAQFLTLSTFLNSTTASALSLFSLLAVTFLLTKIVIVLFLKLLKMGKGGFLYRMAGLLLGACRWIILLSLIFMLIDHSPFAPLRTDIHERSYLGPEISLIAPTLFDFLSKLSPQLTVPKENL